MKLKISEVFLRLFQVNWMLFTPHVLITDNLRTTVFSSFGLPRVPFVNSSRFMLIF